mmetsp:Transcript_36355/g.72043  ORF Transcript_36355/g.72043 Transcript_36355/m.72043 type:complete len:303 (+) Transcript_36355:79-987(+)|eukprot:CAMPEP_0171938246 /NCGR_PEP_ID=MMETSP0993-20121228/35291_1 /TAXON_ID=483369 /ORGANISM="non described non described, Strain CCMP2098" /LENGTH=302 /DNA_ID=CAMNT_0012579767 /DNA_START=60 /DNA_END=968 /DNA_ORIENTATION=+
MDLTPPASSFVPNAGVVGPMLEGGSSTDAMLMSLVAGLSTGLGGCVVFFVSSVSSRVLAFTLSLACGVMTSVSILELMKPILSGEVPPLLWCVFGAALYVLLRSALPDNGAVAANDHKRGDEEFNDERDLNVDTKFSNAQSGGGIDGRDSRWKKKQWRLGMLMMATLTAHNLPEGVAVAVGALQSTRTGIVVMSAIAIHNIPEGLTIAIPIYAATGSRWQALGMTLASGLSEPIGAGLGLLVLQPFLTQSVMDNSACAVGGVMLAVSLLELAPESIKYRDPLASLSGLLVGWLVILLTMKFA